MNTVTLKMDANGCIHMWEGSQGDIKSHPTLPLMDGREADTFIQRQDDIEAIMGYLIVKEAHDLELGYWVESESVPDDYLIND